MTGSKIAFVIFCAALAIWVVAGLWRERKRGIKISAIIDAILSGPFGK